MDKIFHKADHNYKVCKENLYQNCTAGIPFCSHKNNYYNPAIANFQIFRNKLSPLTMAEERSSRDEQCDEKFGLYIADVIWHCKMHERIIENKIAVSN